ncbi:MAG: transcriptional regulator, partial [Desulfobacteraceae bacterium]|nr:transcriptional regulator [Desulfobacteraceae bacterium]
MTTEKDQIFTTLKQLADLTTQMFGNNCEIAIHDLTTQQM